MIDQHILEVITEFRAQILDNKPPHLMCYVVCSPLQALLEQVYGLDCDLVEGRIDLPTEPLWGHYWIAHEDQIIDPTASQFYDAHGQRVPEVYIGDLPDHYIELHRL